MANRILKWVIYTLVFALLPTLISLLFSLIFGFKVNDYSTELLFFTIMICATSLNDIQEMKNQIEKDFVFNFFFGVCLLIIVTVSVIYGSILLVNMSENAISLNCNIKLISIILSILSGIIGFLIQVILYRTEVLR